MNWLQKNAKSGNTYILEASANGSLAPQKLSYSGVNNITIILRGDDKNRIIRLSSNGAMFDIFSGVSLVLENNITLQGRRRNNDSLVRVRGGTFVMNSGTTITGNTNINYGGGVYVISNGNFTMNGGIISGNKAIDGGGVAVYSEGAFTMNGGTISGNTASSLGGGVSVVLGTLIKNGGTITGYASDPAEGNVVKSGSGAILDNKGHAITARSFDSSYTPIMEKNKETTAGPGVNLSYSSDEGTFGGSWDS
jgi:hypothetical protein